MNGAIDQFAAAIGAAGLTPPDNIIADGELHRFASNGKRGDDAGYYCLHLDGIPAGHFGCWRSGASQNWRGDIGRNLSPVEVAALAERSAKMRREREAEKARRTDEAKAEAARRWNAAKPTSPDHSYLHRKGVRPHGTRELDGVLLVPMRDVDGVLWNVERIPPEVGATKKGLFGGRRDELYYAIGKPNGVICIAEGFATGASIHEATGEAVAVAFTAGNVEAVARNMRARFPDVQIVLCADDDYRTDGNPGMTKATEAARAVGGLVAVPDFGADRPEGATDFNDLAQHAGADAVKRALANARAPEASEPQPDAANAPAIDCGLEEWPEPTPLPAELPAVESFALDLMPDALRSWIADIADRVQCPPDFPAVAAMVVLGSVLGRRVPVYPKRRDDWHEYPNLWGGVIGNPGVLKTPAISEVLRPLRELEHLAAEANAADAEDWRRRCAEAAIIRDARKTEARKAARKKQDFDVTEFMDDEGEEPPAMRRYSVNDSSLEALGEILRGNPNGTLVYQDELIGLLKQLDRPGNEPARGFWLAGWSGKEPHTFDRIGRGLNRRIDAVCLSLFGSIQPGVIGDYLREAVLTSGGDGLVARMSMLTWPDVGGQWRNVDRFPDSGARTAARAMFQRFDMVTADAVGATADAIGAVGLRFAADAQDDFDGWREDFERAQRASDVHPALAAHRNKYRKLVPAVALICHLADQPQGGAIGRPALLRALAWAEYLDSHAGRAYASVMRPDADGARELLRRIRRQEVDSPFRARDVYRNGWSRLSDPEQVHRAVRLLCDFDYLRERSDPTGGRPTNVYTVNPRALT